MKKLIVFVGKVYLTLSFILLNQVFAKNVAEDVKKHLEQISPRLSEITLEKTAVKNVFRFWLSNKLNHVYYADGHIIVGDMLNLDRRVSLGEEAQSARIIGLLKAAADKSINYGPKNAKRTIHVFTDIDCAFCRRLHSEIDQITAAGIQVRYFAFPRTGVNSASYDKYVSVWCAEDQNIALNAAKSGTQPVSKTCENPIAETYQLGAELGLRGTPMLVYDDGTIVNGYKPANVLIQELGL